jgi:hypothetical protein
MDTKFIKLFLVSVIFTFIQCKAFTQYCWNNPTTSSTLWSEPSSKNQWNWTTKFADAWIVPNGSIVPEYFQIRMPMWAGPVINNLNVEYFQGQSPENKDHHPEDGWELLFHEFGTEGSSNGNIFPYFFVTDL